METRGKKREREEEEEENWSADALGRRRSLRLAQRERERGPVEYSRMMGRTSRGPRRRSRGAANIRNAVFNWFLFPLTSSVTTLVNATF